MATPEHVKAFAATISRQQVGIILHRPESWAKPTQCFGNVDRKVAQDGGRKQFGWMFHVRRMASKPGAEYLIAANHAVWVARDGTVIDVTPFHADPKHEPITSEGGHVVFLVDDAAAPQVFGNVGVPRPSHFYALGDDPEVLRYVASLQRDEQEEIERMLREYSANDLCR